MINGIGGAGFLVQPGSIRPVGHYVAGGGAGGQVDTVNPLNNIFWRKNGPGESPAGVEDLNNAALQYIQIVPVLPPPNGGPPPFLDACGDANPDSEGTFTTEDPTATLFHGLPANFGRGRGQWRRGDDVFINVWFRVPKVCQVNVQGATLKDIMSPQIISVIFVPGPFPPPNQPPAHALEPLGNIRIRVANIGLAPIPMGDVFSPETNPNPAINIEFMHTIQR